MDANARESAQYHRVVDSVRTLFNRLSFRACRELLEGVGIDAEGLDEGRNFVRTSEIVNRLADAPHGARTEIEAIAGRIVAFSAKADIAERALWSCSDNDPQLTEILNQSASLEERALQFWFRERRSFERANNVASGYHWAGGKFHCAFKVASPGTLVDSLADVAAEIGALIQSQAGGRKVDPDLFSFRDPDTRDEASGGPALIHHLAIYVEAPASYWVGFKDEEDKASPLLRREAKEVSISYNPSKQRLDVSGRGIGGSKMLEKIAQVFEARAIKEIPFEKITRVDWDLEKLLDDEPPVLTAPPGFSAIIVRSLSIRNQSKTGAQAMFRGEGQQSAYDRMAQLGVKATSLAFEMVKSVTLEFKSSATDDVPARRIRMTLNWPNSVSFDGATTQEQDVLNRWAQAQFTGDGDDPAGDN